MEMKRRLALSTALLAVGLGVIYGMTGREAEPLLQASSPATPAPTAIVPLAAQNVALAEPPAALPAPPVLPAQAKAPTRLAAPPVLTAALALTPSEIACPTQLDLAVQPLAVLGLALLAPCHASERVVLRHGGLAITAKTSATGSLFLDLPALARDGAVSVLFADGTSASARIALPELVNFRRFGVQWLAGDAFQVHAFEGAADYGSPGDVSRANPQLPQPGVPAKGGFLSLLGDDQVDLPMLAEVYTYPASADAPVRLVVEAAVTAQTCGRELLGETLSSEAGAATVTDLTLAMPDCSAIGDILVLKNLAPDLKIAAN